MFSKKAPEIVIKKQNNEPIIPEENIFPSIVLVSISLFSPRIIPLPDRYLLDIGLTLSAKCLLLSRDSGGQFNDWFRVVSLCLPVFLELLV